MMMSKIVLLILFLVQIIPGHMSTLRPYHSFTHNIHSKDIIIDYKGGQGRMHNINKEGGIGMELYPTGSSLPDCGHACGACAPCKRVMVSYNKCSVESCPVVYRCMCKGRYYHVPSN